MNLGFIQKLIGDHVLKITDNSRKIYALLMLSIWNNDCDTWIVFKEQKKVKSTNISCVTKTTR